VAKDPKREAKYGEAIPMISAYYEATEPNVKANVYALEAGLIGADITLFAWRFNRTFEAAMAQED